MKAVNTFKFVSNAIEELTHYNDSIAVAERFEESKIVAYKMMGYIGSLITFLNTMICEENA